MTTPSSDFRHTVSVSTQKSVWRRALAFAGPGYLVAVGYMDPGNWATDLAAGSAFGYALLSVILIASLMAIFLQSLSLRLGIATGRDLAQSCRDHYPRPVRWILWVLAEIAICATDLAEIIGTAIALKLLFGIPLTYGVVLTALDVFLLLGLQRFGFRKIEAFIISTMILIMVCFGYNLLLASPDMAAVMQGYIPAAEIFTNTDMLYLAIGILGATVMPHNLYLHSAIAQTRQHDESSEGKKEAIRFASWDSGIALSLAFFVNSAILILAASVFHASGHNTMSEIQDAYHLLTPLLGTQLAATLFGVALLACGINSTLTATLAGQVVMEGFLDIKIPIWARRLITRLIAIIPALAVAILWQESGTAKLLVLSQVILSLQLPFAVIPLLMFVGSKTNMNEFVISPVTKIIGWMMGVTIILLNLWMLWGLVRG